MPIQLSLEVSLLGQKEGEDLPGARVYAFDQSGRLVGTAPVQAKGTRLDLPDELTGQVVTVYAGPDAEDPEGVSRKFLRRRSASERRIVVDKSRLQVDFPVIEGLWHDWFLCDCVVKGRLVKRWQLPDGTTKELPICNARVTICEVDPVPKLIAILPDDILDRIRWELLREIIKPLPYPPPPPPPPPDGWRLEVETPGLTGLRGPEMAAEAEPMRTRSTAMQGPTPGAELFQMPLAAEARLAKTLSSGVSMIELRRVFLDHAELIRPYLCRWDWLWAYYDVDCRPPVMVDEQGRFQRTIWYPCNGDKPDVYIKAEQWNGSSWVDIHSPTVGCNTYWDYKCGSEIVINVTDPAAVSCVPPDPVLPPSGVTTWIMPHFVGGFRVWGTPPSPPPPRPAGFIRSDGFIDYGAVVEAPFGRTLSLQHAYSSNIPTANLKYFRWSYREVGAASWTALTAPIVRHYARQEPGELPTFPVYSLGPKPIGPGNLFEFRPHTVPDEGPPDPPGTTREWPAESWFNEVWTGHFDSLVPEPTPPAGTIGQGQGQYEILLEVFDDAGNQVVPGPGTFTFIFPKEVLADGTVTSRVAQPSEIVGGGVVFKVYIDNNRCTASIDPPAIGGSAVTDACGFLRYAKNTDPAVTIALQGRHPYNRATFGFAMYRGADHLGFASTGGEVAALTPPNSYLGDGNGNFSRNFARSELTGPACKEAAFSENLKVDAKAHTGLGRIWEYDAGAVRAFALAEQQPGPPGP